MTARISSRKAETFLTFFFLYITIYYFELLIFRYSKAIWLYGFPYFAFFYGKKIYPILFFLLYLISKNYPKTTRIINLFSWSCILFSLGLLTLLIMGMLEGNQFREFLGFKWNYAGAIEWTVATLVCYAILLYKTGQPSYSLFFSGIVMQAGGLIYELPLYPRMSPHIGIYYHHTHPCIIATNWLCIFFTAYMLKQQNWKPTKPFLATIPIYIIWSIIYATNPHAYTAWLPRIPTIIMLLALTHGIPKTRG